MLGRILNHRLPQIWLIRTPHATVDLLLFTPQTLGSGNFLVTFTAVPAGEYVVHLRGEDSSSTSKSTPSSFQRQALTRIKTSSISLIVSYL